MLTQADPESTKPAEAGFVRSERRLIARREAQDAAVLGCDINRAFGALVNVPNSPDAVQESLFHHRHLAVVVQVDSRELLAAKSADENIAFPIRE